MRRTRWLTGAYSSKDLPVLGPKAAIKIAQCGRGLDCRSRRGLETSGGRGGGDSDSDNGLTGEGGRETDGRSDHGERDARLR